MKQCVQRQEEAITAANRGLFLVANHPTGSMLTAIMRKVLLTILAITSTGASQAPAQTDTFGNGTNAFVIDFVNIGNRRNVPDTTGFGSVAYDYRISKYEISQDAITKAAASGMSNVIASAWTANQPAASVSWYEAAAFVNWMNATSGHQEAYNITYSNGAWIMQLWDSANAWTAGGTNLFRHKNARYFIASENEWYKAAYYNAAATNYFLYTTASSSAPATVSNGTSANTAVYAGTDGTAIAPASVFQAGGLSAYGTMGQGGNVFEWTETAFDRTNDSSAEDRALRGGDWTSGSFSLRSTTRAQYVFAPEYGFPNIGFRVASTADTPPNALENAATKSPFDIMTASSWSADGSQWTVDTETSHDGADSVKAQTADGQSTYREYTLTGPAVVDFWWKVSSEQGYDTFSYAVNGINQQTISGEVDWTYHTLTLPEGTHAIRWTYSKDESGAVGQDSGWLDDFAVYPATATLQVRDGSTTLTGNAEVNFGSGGGQSALTKTLTFQNSGYAPLKVELSLPSESPFTFEDGSREYLLLLGREDSSNASLLLPVSSAGQKSATLTISAPDSTSPPPSIQLTGTVVGGEILVVQGGSQIISGQPSPVDIGIAPREIEFALSNNGNVADLVISQLSVTGNFQITQQPAATIAVGETTTFKVLASDSQQGVQLGTISITSNDEDTPVFTIPVTSKVLLGLGTGVATNSTSTSGQGGGVGWDFATTSLPSGTTGSALKTGATPPNGQSHLQATFTGAGLLSWKWKVATQENFDWLACEINGREVLAVSTKNAAWREQVVYVPNNGVVKWLYRKDASGTIGEDAGYLADIVFDRFTVPQVSYSNWWASFGRPTPPAATSPLARSGLPSVMSWVGGFNPDTAPATNHYRPIIEGGQLKLIYPVSRKYSGGSVTAEYASDLSGGWSGAGMTQRLHSQDADTIILEATPPAGAEKGFMRLKVR